MFFLHVWVRPMPHFSVGIHIHCLDLLEQENEEDAYPQLGRVHEPQDVASSHLVLRPSGQHLHLMLRLVTPGTHSKIQLCRDTSACHDWPEEQNHRVIELEVALNLISFQAPAGDRDTFPQTSCSNTLLSVCWDPPLAHNNSPAGRDSHSTMCSCPASTSCEEEEEILVVRVC